MSRLLEVAIAAHPTPWRDKYASVVRGTLLDVADDRGGRVPASETLPLLLRGLWMRARGSVAFWGGLVVVAIQVWVAATSDNFTFEDSTASSVRQLDNGLYYVLVVLGLLAGWAGARARMSTIRSVSARMRRLAYDSWPLLTGVALGYAIAFVGLIARFGVPWFAWPTLVLMATQVTLVLTAIAIGQMLGAVLPRVLVIFAGPIAVGAFVAFVLSGSTALAAQSFRSYFGVAYKLDLDSFARGEAICGVIVLTAIGVVALRPIWLRSLPVAALIGAAVVGAAIGRPYYLAPDPVPRAESELICSENAPVVCLWPEQESAFGSEYRQQVAAAYEAASALGLPVDGLGPTSVARFAMTGIAAQEGVSVDDLAEFGFGYGMTVKRDQIVNAYAWSMVDGLWVEPTLGDGQTHELTHAIAVLLGVPADKTWAVVVDPPTGQRFLDSADAPDAAESRALVERWLADGVDGVRAPS